jgi:MFS family permease
MIYLFGHVNGWIMAAYTFLITTVESFNMPAGTAFIPNVIKKEHLTCGMSLNTTMTGLFTLVGTGIAGVIIAKAGLFTVMIIDTATFFIAALIIMTIRSEKTEAGAEESVKEPYFKSLVEGIRYIRRDKVIVNYFIIAVLLNPLLVPINSLQAPLVGECYHMGSELLSVIGIAGSMGSIIGSALIPTISRKMSMKKVVTYFGLIMGFGIMLVPFGGMISSSIVIKYIAAFICFCLMTMASCIIVGMLNIQFVTNIDKRYLARSISVFSSISTATIPVTSLIVGWAKLRFETGTLITFCGVFAILLFIILSFINPDLDMGKEIEDEIKAA